MEIILLERIENLGQMGDVVTVKDGYARNYLLPQKKALRANKDNIAYFEKQKKELEARDLERKSEAESVAKKMEGYVCVLERQAGESDQLYGSVTAKDVTAGLLDAGFNIDRGQVVLDRPIKQVGVYDVRVALHPEVSTTVKVNVARSAEEAERQIAAGEAPETEEFFETKELAREAEEQLSQAQAEEDQEEEQAAEAAEEPAKSEDAAEDKSADEGNSAGDEKKDE